MRILLINNLFQPEPNHLKGLAFAKALQERGHQITVLTGFPNYPGGKVYPGYRIRWTQREMIDGVNVIRVAMYPSHDDSAARRSLNFLSLGLSMVLHAPWLGRFDACYVYMGPITLMWPAIYMKWFRGSRLIADVQDIWPESVADSGMLKARLPMMLIRALTQWSYRRADRFVVLSPGYREKLIARGFAADRIRVVYNWASERANGVASDPSPAACGKGDRLDIVYAGNIGRLQSLGTVLDAARILGSQGSRAYFSLIGGGVEYEQMARRVAEESLTNVSVLPRVSAAIAREIQEQSDVLLLHLLRSDLTKIAIPQKIQSYMSAGRPIIAAVAGDAAELVQQAECGLVCEPSNAQKLADTVTELEKLSSDARSDMGKRGRAYYHAHLSFQEGVDRVAALLEELAPGL